MKYRFILALTIFSIAKLFCQQHDHLNPRVKRIIDSVYTSLIKKNKVVGMSIAIVDSGKIVYSKGYGFANREKNIAATDKTIYRIGSCSKSFTSLSIMQLHQKKRLNYQNSVKNYLPELTIGSRFNDNNPIYISDMMSHLSGLPCDIANGFFCDAPPNEKWVIEELNKQTTISTRAYKHAYSNVAYGLLGEVIARQSESTYNNYLQENIFSPLKMSSSFVEMSDKYLPELSQGYFKNKPFKEPLIRDAAAGLIHSNVIDMSNYLMMYLNKGQFNGSTILSEDLISEMEKNRTKDVVLSHSENWGYGLYNKTVWIKNGKDSVATNITGHAGDTYVFHADFAYIRDLNIGVVVLTNSDTGPSTRSGARLLRIYLKEAKKRILNLNYSDTKDSTAFYNETNCKPEEITGVYNTGEILVNVKNLKKIKFKQGPAKIVLKQKDANLNTYKVKAMLLGIIPIKIKDQEFQFVKLKDGIYAKAVNTKTKEDEYLVYKTQVTNQMSDWKNKFGKYKILNANYPCTNCPYGVHEGMTLNLSEKKGFLKLETKGKTPDLNGTVYANILSAELAVTGGIGRGTGESLRVLKNGNLYYSGFEFEKLK